MVDRYVLIQTQTPFTNESFGSFGANSHVLDVGGEDITGDMQYIYPMTATGRVKRNKIQGPKKFSGTFDVPLYPREAASLLYYGLGALTTTLNTPGAGVNTHTIKVAKTIPFFRTAIGRDQKEHRYTGGIIKGVTLDYKPDDLLMGSFDAVFRKELSPSTLSTSVTFPDYNSAERPFGGSEVVVELNDTVDSAVESLEITIENNVEEDAFALGSAYLPAGIVNEFGITGSMDLRYDNATRYENWLNGDNLKIELLASYGSGASLRKINVTLPVVSLDTNSLPTEGLERFVQSLDFTPQRDANGDPIIIDIVNTRTNAQMAG